MKDDETVTASEMADYVFCKRSWWLKRNFTMPATEEMVEGTAAHETMAVSVNSLHKKKVIAWILIGLGILMLFLYFLIKILL